MSEVELSVSAQIGQRNYYVGVAMRAVAMLIDVGVRTTEVQKRAFYCHDERSLSSYKQPPKPPLCLEDATETCIVPGNSRLFHFLYFMGTY